MTHPRRHRAVPVQTPLGEQHYDRGGGRVRVIPVPAEADTLEQLVAALLELLRRPSPKR